ncbi:CIC11C00000005114 [Sungouiella intermedia]|uniref:CIC11C00000005114 n=1 Tax=Sungouiella intermedia TaxID=45354 RepID=A0A1L0BXB4_9ASCO|nr:CIC11C00000005114 [[Candida] intermedia]
MAFNPAVERRKRAPVRATPVENESSLFSESQSLWVVFNPPDKLENDILSFSTNNPLTATDDESEFQSEFQSGDEENAADGNATDAAYPADDEYDDELYDGLHQSLSSRINEWQLATEAAVLDNVASWDLDAELVQLLLDKSILRRVPSFYGDHYFENMSKADYMRFKRATTMLKKSLSRKGYKNSNPELLTRVLELLLWQSLLQTSGSLVNDYIVNTLARTHFVDPPYKDVEFSDTATLSSLVICGGSSWNDI